MTIFFIGYNIKCKQSRTMLHLHVIYIPSQNTYDSSTP